MLERFFDNVDNRAHKIAFYDGKKRLQALFRQVLAEYEECTIPHIRYTDNSDKKTETKSEREFYSVLAQLEDRYRIAEAEQNKRCGIM